MRHIDLPERWKNKVQDYLTAKGETKYKTLSTSDFTAYSTVKIRFEDDSKVEFKYAFVIKAPEFNEVGVFTEHCGYHLFPLYEGLELVVEKDDSQSSA